MRVAVAAGYLALVLIWSSVPLAVKWAVIDFGYAFGSVLRFAICVVVLVLAGLILRIRVPFDVDARRTYLLAAMNFYTFIAIFWGAQFVPSGWLGLIWGISPFVTATFSHFLLGETAFSPLRVAGMILGFAGLVLIFGAAVDFGPRAVQGLSAMLVGVVISSWTSVKIKGIDSQAPPFAVTLVAAGLALPAYVLSWYWSGAVVPAEPGMRAIFSIVYVGIPGTALVFVLLYYVLRHVRATQVSLIGLISPVLALLLGNLVNGEVIAGRVWAGTGVIVLGLILHEVLPRRHSPDSAYRA